MLTRSKVLCVAVIGLLAIACGDDSKQQQQSWPDFGDGPAARPDQGITDIGELPDGLPANPEGPVIEFQSPMAGEVVAGAVVKIRAKITDPDGIDDQSVTVTALNGDPVKMTITSENDVYEGLVDISVFTDNVAVRVQAADLGGQANTKDLLFKRDPGPQIQIISPAEDSRHKGSVSVRVVVTPRGGRTIKATEVRIGSVMVTTTSKDLANGKKEYTGTIKFDDPQFVPPLSGAQVISVDATNSEDTTSSAQRNFVVDDAGPTIAITSQVAGQLIGGIIQLRAEVKDEAGIVPSTVRVVIGNNLDTRNVVLRNSAGTSVWTGQFDTRTLQQNYLWPVMSFRAADTLGNESHEDIEVGLDNGAPVIELDQQGTYYHWREKEKKFEASHPFDALGTDTANDGDQVPQITKLRARVEDSGNYAPSAPWIPISAVDFSTVRMFVLDDTSQALVVDTDDDGYCDAINPNLIPKGSTPAPGQAVAVTMVGLAPSGTADFTPTGSPPGGFDDGTDPDPPKPLCKTTPSTVWTYANSTANRPAIFTIPPISSTSIGCEGLPFDFLANQFTDKSWVCVAVSARDNLGNRGVSQPLRVFYDQSYVPTAYGYTPYTGGTAMPNCTGTLQANGTVDTSKPCMFRAAGDPKPQRFPTSWLKEQ
ncbi:MAG: hypothetical protein KC503_39435 [Myxococcales bacterium]|nr:hypothetical protein [Myxococcales bacterium]